MPSFAAHVATTPLRYLARIRRLTFKQLLLQGSSLSPAYSVFLAASVLLTFAFTGFLCYFFFIEPSNIPCYSQIRIGVMALVVLYSLQTVISLYILLGTTAETDSVCFRIALMLLHGPLSIGVNFGGLGFVYLCILNNDFALFLNPAFGQKIVIEVIVYLYLSFAVLLVLGVPLSSFLYSEKQVRHHSKSCCDRFMCIFDMFLRLCLVLLTIGIIGIKLIGVPMLGYVLFEVTRAFIYSSSTQVTFFVLAILAIFVPFLLFLIVYIVTNYCRRSNRTITSDKQESRETQDTSRENQQQLIRVNQLRAGHNSANHKVMGEL